MFGYQVKTVALSFLKFSYSLPTNVKSISTYSAPQFLDIPIVLLYNYLIFLFWIHFSCKCRFFPPGYLIWAGFCTGLIRFTKKELVVFVKKWIDWKRKMISRLFGIRLVVLSPFFCGRAYPGDQKEALLHHVTATV